MSNRLNNIVARQSRMAFRDMLFVAFVVLATAIGASSVSTAAHAAAVEQAAQAPTTINT